MLHDSLDIVELWDPPECALYQTGLCNDLDWVTEAPRTLFNLEISTCDFLGRFQNIPHRISMPVSDV